MELFMLSKRLKNFKMTLKFDQFQDQLQINIDYMLDSVPLTNSDDIM
jgi:hypothetical protein